jgi:hypothetical protein
MPSLTAREACRQSGPQGCESLSYGKTYIHPDHANRHYFSPTLVVDVNPDINIAKEESFGSIMVLMRGPLSKSEDILAPASYRLKGERHAWNTGDYHGLYLASQNASRSLVCLPAKFELVSF